MITDISHLAPSGTNTYDDCLQWQFDESIELTRGTLYRVSQAPKGEHQRASANLEFTVLNYSEDKSCKVPEEECYVLIDAYESGKIPSDLFPNLLVSHDRIFR